MAYMVSTALSIHWVKRIEARSNTEGTITLAFYGDAEASAEQHNMAEVVVFMDDHGLVERLMTAINSQNVEVDQTFTPMYPNVLIESDNDDPSF